jgi:hypothetical protein
MARNSEPLLDLSRVAQLTLIEGARDAEPVSGLTHDFYKYPARFSPAFVRAAIEAFTDPAICASTPTLAAERRSWKHWPPVETQSAST